MMVGEGTGDSKAKVGYIWPLSAIFLFTFLKIEPPNKSTALRNLVLIYEYPITTHYVGTAF